MAWCQIKYVIPLLILGVWELVVWEYLIMGDTSMSDSHKGKCFCGAVEVKVTGAPEGMGYCHCESCRSWSAGPVNAFTLWKPDAVKIT